MKINFVNSPKKHIFAIVNQQLGLPKRVLFAYSANGELGHFAIV